MIHFEEIFINEKKFEVNHPNSANFKLHQHKFDSFLLKKFWESLNIKQKEACFTLKNQKIIENFIKITQIMPQMRVNNLNSPIKLNNLYRISSL